MATTSNTSKTPVVAVLNMKGGVGKTTIAAHVFRHLYSHLRKAVLLVDFDPQFNLTQTIISQTDYEKHKADRRTILSVMENQASPSIFTVSDDPGPPPALDSVSVSLRQFRGSQVSLKIVPGDFDLVKYSLIADNNVLAPVRTRFLKFIETCRLQTDLICIDCNPSSSFMTICALKAATHVLVPVRPDRYSLQGLKMLNKFIENMPDLAVKPKLIVVLNGIHSSAYDPAVENSLRSDPDFGPATLVSSLHVSRVLEANMDYTGFATDKKQGWRVTPRITAIVTELKKELGLS